MSEKATRVTPPPLVVRVGVTGHRALGVGGDRLIRLRATIETVLAAVEMAVDDVKTRPGKALFSDQPACRLVSSLAQGADTLVATVALERGFELEAILPFSFEDYLEDFRGQRAETLHAALLPALSPLWDVDDAIRMLDGLLARAAPRILEIDGRHDPQLLKDRSYLAAGRLMVRRCDLIIAVWNGELAAGAGGTGDVVDFARRNGVPVLQVHPEQPQEVIFHGLHDGQIGATPLEATKEILAPLLANTLGSAMLPARPHHGARKTAPPLTFETFVSESSDRVRAPGKLFRWLRDCLAKDRRRHRRPRAAAGTPAPVLSAGERRYRDLQDWPDRLAVKYGEYYRSAFVGIFLLGFAALACAILAVALAEYPNPKRAFTVIELVLLAAITVIFLGERSRGWHRRWLGYRLVAELLRQMSFLSLLGRSLPIERAPIAIRARGTGSEWLLKYVHACIRSMPLERTRFDPQWIKAVRDHVTKQLVHAQLRYHDTTHKRSEAVDGRLGVIAGRLFVATLVIVLIKVALIILIKVGVIVDVSHPTNVVLGVLAGILPALAAAIFAIRHQGEFEVVANRSRALGAVLREGEQWLIAVDCEQPLASEDLGRAMYALAESMVSDVDEWALIFEVKHVEMP